MKPVNNKKNTPTLLTDILEALSSLDGWGSVEIFVQDGKVTQITKRAIRKTKHIIMKV